MTTDPTLELWRTIALYAVAIGQTLFVMLYATFPWFRTFLGRALFLMGFVFAALVDLGLIARENPLLLNWDLVFTILYALLAVGVWYQFISFLRIRRAGMQNVAGTKR